MEWVIQPLTQSHALEIANAWKYEGIYSFYDMTADVEDYEEFVDEERRNQNDHYEVLESHEVIGFFCVFQENTSIEIGLGMRPDVCGKGKGKRFVEQILEFIGRAYSFDQLVVNVASFNQRAIKVYRACGFEDSEITQRHTNGGVYEFLTMVRRGAERPE